MRFSIAFLLSATAWVTFLPVSISATLPSSYRTDQAAAATIGLLSFIYVAVAALQLTSKSGKARQYWKGSCIFCGCFIGFLIFQEINIERRALGPIVAFVGSKLSTEPNGSVITSSEEDPIAEVFAVWLIPVFGTIGGITAEFLYRRPMHHEPQQLGDSIPDLSIDSECDLE